SRNPSMQAIGLVKMESVMQKKSSLVYAIAAGVAVVLIATPAFARQAQKTSNTDDYQMQSASSSYALAPQQTGMVNRSGRCWIATDSSRGFGYVSSCSNPLAQDPALDPTYNPQW